jgi:hypothetical protein
MRAFPFLFLAASFFLAAARGEILISDSFDDRVSEEVLTGTAPNGVGATLWKALGDENFARTTAGAVVAIPARASEKR